MKKRRIRNRKKRRIRTRKRRIRTIVRREE